MAPPDSLAGGARAKLYLSQADNSLQSMESRAEKLARKLDERLKSRLDHIRDQVAAPATSPNSERTGTRIDILA